jgi:hypothetical protein
MTTRLTEDLRDILHSNNYEPLRLYDDKDQRAYVVVSEAIFERLCATSDDDHIAMIYPHIGKLIAMDGLGAEA